jgi:Ca-activated chloride channel family protein
MNPFLRLVILVLGLVCATAAAGQQPPVFRGTGEVVRVFVTVTDRDGRLVTTLTRDEFEVRDEGKPQPITLFDNTPQPIRLVVMLDVSGSMEGNLPLLRASAEHLFSRLRPDDQVRVGSFGHEVVLSPSFTRDVETPARLSPTRLRPTRQRRCGAPWTMPCPRSGRTVKPAP